MRTAKKPKAQSAGIELVIWSSSVTNANIILVPALRKVISLVSVYQASPARSRPNSQAGTCAPVGVPDSSGGASLLLDEAPSAVRSQPL